MCSTLQCHRRAGRPYFPWVAGIHWTALLLAAGMAASASAASVIINTGFEAAGGYNLGLVLENHDDWKRATIGGGASTASVQGTTFKSGTQALQVNRGAVSDDRWAIPVSGYPTGRYIIINWDMLTKLTPSDEGVGPFFGIEAYDDDGPVRPAVIGALGVDAATGDVLYERGNNGVLTESGATIDFNQWHNFRMVLDFVAEKTHHFFDGDHLTSQNYVDGALGIDEFTDADISAFAASFDQASAILTGTAFFDNFRVFDGVLPGDYNHDGVVDSNDYDVWTMAFGEAAVAPGLGADGNGDGIVDAADYTVWRDNLGNSLFGSGSAIGTAIPEPSGLLLVAAALLSLVGRRSCRGRG